MRRAGRLWRLSILAALWALPALLFAGNLTYFKTVSSTDFAIFGAGGMRGQGAGSIVVSGISSTVTAAYLFWHGPRNDSLDSNATVAFNGGSSIGLNIGISADNGWALDHSAAYRADVTSLVTGNGTYILSNFRKAGPPLAEINGVSLVIFFNDGDPANDRDIVIFNGNDSNKINNFDTDGWSVTLPGINYVSGTVNMLLVVSDGQVWNDDELRINGTTYLSSGGSGWQGGTVPDQGRAATTDGGLWDHRSFDVTSLMSPGLNTLQIQPTTYVDDQLSLNAVLFDLPVGAAPLLPTPTEQTPTPTSTPTPPPTQTPTQPPAPTPAPSPSPTSAPPATPTWTLTPTSTPTRSRTATRSTRTPTPTPRRTRTATPTPPTPVATVVPPDRRAPVLHPDRRRTTPRVVERTPVP